MPKYLVKVSYTVDGSKALIKAGGSVRRTAVQEMLGGIGGKLEAFYFAFGEDDVIAIADLPDNVSAAAVALTINAAGSAQTNVTVLLTPEEVDAAAKKLVKYSAPGQLP